MAVKSIGLILLAALVARPVLAEEILRPRDKAGFEAELRALQAQYGTPPAAQADAAEAPVAVASPADTSDPTAVTAQAALTQVEPVAAAPAVERATVDPGEPVAAAPEAPARPVFPGTLLQPRRATEPKAVTDTTSAAEATQVPVAAVDAPPAAASVANTRPEPAAPVVSFPGTVLRPRSQGSGEPATVATASAEPASIPPAAAPSASSPPAAVSAPFPGTVLRPRSASESAATAINAPVATASMQVAPATAATEASTEAAAAPLFEGTTLAPRGRDAAASVLSSTTPTRPVRDVAPMQRLTPPASANADGIPALRVALLPVGQHQFQLREQIYDVDSLEIYLRQLQQPIDSVVLLSEDGRRIELGHLVALGRLGRLLRVPTLYQQGTQLRALNIR